MNRTLLAAIILLPLSVASGILLGWWVVGAEQQEAPARQFLAYSSAPPAPSPSPPPPALPATLQIPLLNVAAAVEHVGENSEGDMDVPKDANNVAWYQYGYLPGAPGSAVIAGHLDSETGPAVFYELETLQAGDDIFVTDAAGRQLHYKDTRTATHPAASFPIQEVFGPAAASQLNLITCEGTYDRASKNYSDRTVVYSMLVQ
jgi:sortase (surface protein transpeptidase)